MVAKEKMMIRFVGTLLAAVLLLIGTAALAGAQSDDATAEDDVVMVTAVEYAFHGLPTSVPAGTSLGLANDGAEVHEIQLYRIADGVGASVEELLDMYLVRGEDPEAAGLVEAIGRASYAAPGGEAEDTHRLEREGRYAIICLIPQGLTDIDLLEGLGPDTDPADFPPELLELLANPPHATLGMVGEFTVAAPTSGTLPDPAGAQPEGSGPVDSDEPAS